jgi:hypothetical protein
MESPNLTDSSKNFLNSSNGIKLLLSMKTNYPLLLDENDSVHISDENVEEISNEEMTKNLKEMDDLIMDIYRTKSKLKLGKIRSKVKTREDLLNFLNIRDEENNLISPEPASKNSDKFLQKIKINTNSKMNQEFSEIKEKLKNQEQILQNKKESTNNDIFNLTSAEKIQQTDSNDEMEEIFKQIKLMDSKCEDLLDDIDSCIKLGEDINNIIEENNLSDNKSRLKTD